MLFKQQIQKDLNEAIKKKEELKSLVLRMLSASILNKEKEKRYKLARQNFPSENLSGPGKENQFNEEELAKQSQLTDEEVVDVLLSEIKKRKEAMADYERGGRQELAEKEKDEIEILQQYLPEQLSEEEIKKLVKGAIERAGAKELKDMGKVIAELMPHVKGKVDGSLVSKTVKDLLAQ